MSKKLIVTLSAVLLFVAAACQKAEENIGGYEFNTPELKASAPEVNILSIRDGEALKVSWAAAEEKGVVYHLNYSLEGAGEDGIKSLTATATRVSLILTRNSMRCARNWALRKEQTSN